MVDEQLKKGQNRSQKKRYPFILQFGITSKCNLRCKHCYDAREEHMHMSFDKCITVLDKFFAFCSQWNKVPVIWLSGGEPTLHPHLWEIIDYIRDCEDVGTDSSVTILSNGISITDQFIRNLENYPLRTGVQISIDGACAETHDAIRGEGSFDQALGALQLLRLTPIIAHMHFVVHKQNYADGFKMTELAKAMGVDILTVTRLVPYGRGKELEETMLTPDQVYTLFKKLSDDFDTILSTSNPPKPYIARNRCDWPVIYPDPSTSEAHAKNGSRCTAGLSYINVMENGDVYPCRRLPLTIGNIFKEDFNKIWQHPLLWKLRQKHRFMQGKCQNCYFNVKAYHLCSGGASCIAYACYEDPFQPDPQCNINPQESPAGIK